MKKFLSVILALVVMLTTVFSVNLFAKVNLPTISKNKPLTTYTYNSSGKVYAYTASNLKTKTGGYIDCAKDECKIIEISGKAVKVIYPVSNGTKTAWFSRDEFTKRDLANDAAVLSFTAQTKATTYKWKGKSNTFGSVAKGDKCYLLRGNENNDWVQIIYPVSKGHKMGWVKGSDYAKLRGIKVESTPNPVSTSLCSPVPQGCYFNKKTTDCGGSNWYGYHDINRNVSSSTPVYAIADGTIKCLQKYTTIGGKKYLVSYGNLIEFTSSDKVYTAKYAHLSKFNDVTQKISSKNTKQLSASKCSNGVKTYTLATKNVKKGEIIGYIGTTGNSSGVHLHFELRKQGTRIEPTSIFDGLTAK